MPPKPVASVNTATVLPASIVPTRVVNGVTLPTVAARKIPRQYIRNQAETYTLSVWVDVFLDPPKELPETVTTDGEKGQQEEDQQKAKTQERDAASASHQQQQQQAHATKKVEQQTGGKRRLSLSQQSAQHQHHHQQQQHKKRGSRASHEVAAAKETTPKEAESTEKGDINGDLWNQGVEHVPRGPFCVRIPKDATVPEATEIVVQSLRQQWVVSEQQQRSATLTPMSAASPGNTRRHRTSSVAPPSMTQQQQQQQQTSPAAAGTDITLLGRDSVRLTPEVAAHVMHDSALGNFILRPCDPLGQVLKDRLFSKPPVYASAAQRKAIAFQPSTARYTLLHQLGSAPPLIATLAPDPDVFRAHLRDINHRFLEVKQAHAEMIAMRREENLLAIEDRRLAQEERSFAHSVKVDEAFRRSVKVLGASEEMQEYNKLTFTENKLHERREALRRAEEEESRTRCYFQTLLEDIVLAKIQCEELCDATIQRDVVRAEDAEWISLMAAFSEGQRSILSKFRVRKELREMRKRLDLEIVGDSTSCTFF